MKLRTVLHRERVPVFGAAGRIDSVHETEWREEADLHAKHVAEMAAIAKQQKADLESALNFARLDAQHLAAQVVELQAQLQAQANVIEIERNANRHALEEFLDRQQRQAEADAAAIQDGTHPSSQATLALLHALARVVAAPEAVYVLPDDLVDVRRLASLEQEHRAIAMLMHPDEAVPTRLHWVLPRRGEEAT